MKYHDRKHFRENSIGVTNRGGQIAIRSKAIRSECRAEGGPAIAVNPWGVALLSAESEEIAMRARFTPKI